MALKIQFYGVYYRSLADNPSRFVVTLNIESSCTVDPTERQVYICTEVLTDTKLTRYILPCVL